MGSASSRSAEPISVNADRQIANDESNTKNKEAETAEEKDVDTAAQDEGHDVMISYSHANKTEMLRLKAGLETAGLRVWVDMVGLRAGVDFLAKIGQAIIDAKMVISLLSEKTIESKYCQDELALAYVSNKIIYPVALQTAAELFPKMDTGMKLQLARCEWHLFLNPDEFDENLEKLIAAMKMHLEETEPGKQNKSQMFTHEGASSERVVRGTTGSMLSKRQMSDPGGGQISYEDMKNFWDRYFENEEGVEWNKFLDAMLKDYSAAISTMFAEDEHEWVYSIVHRELLVNEASGFVIKPNYDEFCSVNGEFMPFWHRVQDQCVEEYTMKEVFNMDSSVRVEAIENLAKFNSPAVIEALLDLLSDKDNNVCCVAAISLAKTGTTKPKVIKKLIECLDNKDRLVRESGCLALGHLKAEAAVGKIVHLWRNDYISSVREAAQVALEQIGGEEANKAMHMTKVLAEEIRKLTNE